MRVHHLGCGTMCPRSFAAVPEVDLPVVCHCLLIETGAGLVLVDTGVGRDAAHHPLRTMGPSAITLGIRREPGTSAVERVRALGFEPDEVRHIVPTHLDFDHAGGLPDFPRAAVHVAEAELARARGLLRGFDRVRYMPRTWVHGPDWRPFLPGGERWRGFEGARPLAGLPPEILVVPLPGHTAGHVGVAARSGERWLLHVGDAYYSRREVVAGRRSLRARAFRRMIDFDPAAAKRTGASLGQLLRSDPELTMVSSHDPWELAAFRS